MTFGVKPRSALAEAMRALPVGVAILDGDQRILLVNPAFCEAMRVPSDSFPPGTHLSDLLRTGAYRGLLGPGDPEQQVAEALSADRSRPQHLRRAHFDGRCYDLHSAPLAQGGLVVCAVETAQLPSAPDEAETAAARIGSAITAMRIGLATFGADRRLRLHNPRFAELLGLTPATLPRGLHFAELIGLLRFRDEYAGSDGEAFLAAQLVLDRSRPSGLRRLRPNGQLIDIASDPLPDGGWTMTAMDISPLARAEDEARQRATMLDGILACIPHGVCVYGPDRRLTMANRAYAEIMKGAPVAPGDSVEQVIRRRAAAGEFGPGDPDEIARQQLSFDVTRPQFRRRRRPNGTTIDIRTAPLPDGGHISVVTDITSLMQAEDEVTRRAEEMDVMLANIRHGIVLFGPDHRVIASNRIAAELLNHPPGLVIPGRSQAEILEHMRARGEFDGERDSQAFSQNRLLTDRKKPQLFRRTTRAGRALEIRSDPAPGGGFVVTYTDVSEARAVEVELRRAKEAAEAANQAKSRFLATMSHELRTPLNAVIGFSDALLREGGTPDPVRVGEFAQEINGAGRHLLSLINNILDVARIEAGRFDLATDRIDLLRLVRNCVRQADPAARAAEIALEIDVAPELPVLQADERRLQQVLTHLLSNAVKFTGEGGVVTVSGGVDGNGNLLLRVADTGIGIDEADLERVFEPFIQLDGSLSRRFQGAGLGLYVSRALVEAQGGRLRLSSEPGVGTTAEVCLPASCPARPGAGPIDVSQESA